MGFDILRTGLNLTTEDTEFTEGDCKGGRVHFLPFLQFYGFDK
jgi:hypothetical protein